MRHASWVRAFRGAILASMFAFASAAAQARLTEAELERQTREVASQLRCPVCQGESIQESPASLAQEMRALVRSQLAEGRSPDEVKAYFVSKYGEWILLQPRPAGFTMLVYLLPMAALVVGTAVVALVVKRWTGGAAVEPQEETGSA